MADEPKSGATETPGGSGVANPGGTSGSTGGDNPPAGESISIEKARELRSENKSLRDRLRALEDEQKKRDEDARKAAEAKAREEGRLADVLAERDREIAELRPRVALAEKLEGLFTAEFDDESKDWPDPVKAMIPETLEAKIDATPKLRALAAGFSTTAPTPLPPTGNSRPPKPASSPDPASAVQVAREALLRKGGYTL